MSSHTGISAYHWQIISYLAWFSSVTHLSGLTVLRNRLANDRRNVRVRVVLMFALLALLLVAIIPTGYFSWANSQFRDLTGAEKRKFMSSPALCYLKPDSGTWNLWGSAVAQSSVTKTGSFQSMIISVVFLIAGFSARTVKMCGGLSQRFTQKISRPISRALQRLLPSENNRRDEPELRCIWHITVARPCLALFLSTRIITDCCSSLLVEVWKCCNTPCAI